MIHCLQQAGSDGSWGGGVREREREIYIYIYIFDRVYSCMYVCMYVYIYMGVCMYVYIYIYIHARSMRLHGYLWFYGLGLGDPLAAITNWAMTMPL